MIFNIYYEEIFKHMYLCTLSHFSCARLFEAPTRLLCPWDSPGKNPGVGCHFLPQNTHTHTHIYVYIYVCVYIYIYIYIYTHIIIYCYIYTYLLLESSLYITSFPLPVLPPCPLAQMLLSALFLVYIY